MCEVIYVMTKEETKAGGEQQMKKSLRVKNNICNKKIREDTENKDRYA